MPTYNRAELLPLAIESVLQQTFRDFELIISNGGSTDKTKEAVESFTDSRIRYVESEKRLSIGENYLAALNQASGEFITFLGDDDAFVPTMFERVKKIIEKNRAQIVGFRFANYYHDEYVESYDERFAANTLQIQPFTDKVTKFTAAQAVENLYQVHGLNSLAENDKFIVPYLANAVYHRGVFKRVRTVNKNPFAATPADMYLAAAVFFVIDSYFCLDAPLHVWSRWSGSSTAVAHEKGNALRAHYEKLLGGELLKFTPTKFPLPHNCAVNAILQAANEFGTATDCRVDWLAYYVTTYENLLYLKSLKIDVSRELNEFHDALATTSPELKERVESEIKRPTLRLKLFLRDNLPAVLRAGKKLLRRKESDAPRLIGGGEHGFRNVLEAARFLGDRLPEV